MNMNENKQFDFEIKGFKIDGQVKQDQSTLNLPEIVQKNASEVIISKQYDPNKLYDPSKSFLEQSNVGEGINNKSIVAKDYQDFMDVKQQLDEEDELLQNNNMDFNPLLSYSLDTDMRYLIYLD